jgi:hypothetical protein
MRMMPTRDERQRQLGIVHEGETHAGVLHEIGAVRDATQHRPIKAGQRDHARHLFRGDAHQINRRIAEMPYVRRTAPITTSIILLALLALPNTGCCDDPAEQQAPTAAFTWAPNCNLQPDVGFAADVSTPGDAPIAHYYWDLGHDDETAQGMSIFHVFPAAGTYTITLTVVDEDGLSHTVSETLDLWTCLGIVSSDVVITGTVAYATFDVENQSGHAAAIPSFDVDLLDADGLVRFADLDAGQHTIGLDEVVTINSEQVDCADRCDELVDATLKVVWNGWEP